MMTALYRMTLLASVFTLLSAPIFAQTDNTEARRHIVRGVAAIEAAKTEDELADAAAEFKKATEIAPQMAAAWYNLGAVQVKIGQFGEAIDSYRKYLALAPQADNANLIKDEIIKLEYRLEKKQEIKSRSGAWVSEDGQLFQLSAPGGNRMTLASNIYRAHNTELEENDPFNKGFPSVKPTAMKYILDLHGNKIAGSWSRAETRADVCVFPEDNGELTGELRDADHMMILRYTFTRYHHYKQVSLFGSDSCREGETEKKEAEKKFFGPLPQGGIDIPLHGLHSYCSSWGCKDGWSGRLSVGRIKKDSPEYAAGLRNGDEIVAIDNAAVKTLSPSDVVLRLRGAPGTEVVLSVTRGGQAEIRLRRVAITDGH